MSLNAPPNIFLEVWRPKQHDHFDKVFYQADPRAAPSTYLQLHKDLWAIWRK